MHVRTSSHTSASSKQPRRISKPSFHKIIVFCMLDFLVINRNWWDGNWFFCKLDSTFKQILRDWRVKSSNIKNNERWTFFVFDIHEPFSYWQCVFPLIYWCFWLNYVVDFIENHFAYFTNTGPWRINQGTGNFVREIFFVIFDSYVFFFLLHFIYPTLLYPTHQAFFCDLLWSMVNVEWFFEGFADL